jgi:hypothetical protein
VTEDDRSASLDDLSARLEGLISSFGGDRSPTGEAVQAAWTACARAFDAFRTAFEASPEPVVSPEMRSRIEQVLKLEAVATGLACRERDEVAAQLENLSGVRARLRGYAASDPTGESCNVHG